MKLYSPEKSKRPSQFISAEITQKGHSRLYPLGEVKKAILDYILMENSGHSKKDGSSMMSGFPREIDGPRKQDAKRDIYISKTLIKCLRPQVPV